MSSFLTSCSLARIRLEIVTRRSPNRPSLVFPQMCVNPRKSDVSGLPRPRAFRRRAACRPNSISRVLPSSSPSGVCDHFPSSMTPAFSHLRSRRSMRPSAIRCPGNFSGQP